MRRDCVCFTYLYVHVIVSKVAANSCMLNVTFGSVSQSDGLFNLVRSRKHM